MKYRRGKPWKRTSVEGAHAWSWAWSPITRQRSGKCSACGATYAKRHKPCTPERERERQYQR